MADEQYDTPSGNPPVSPAEFALQTLARALREASDGYLARLEVYRGLSPTERDVGLAREADHARDLKHLAGEAEQILRALVGYRTPDGVRRIVPVRRASNAKAWAVVMTALAAVGGAIAAIINALKGAKP